MASGLVPNTTKTFIKIKHPRGEIESRSQEPNHLCHVVTACPGERPTAVRGHTSLWGMPNWSEVCPQLMPETAPGAAREP